MKIYKIPNIVKTIIFDIDSTLYTCTAYALEQVDCQVREYARVNGMTADEARKKVADFRQKFALENNGKKISLGNTLLNFGVPISQSVKWRNELMRPQDYLKQDLKLREVLLKLKENYNLICVTNNPVLPARKTLEVIGVSDLFKDIVGLDTCLKSKPALEPFMRAVELTGSSVEECVAVGDRYDMDVALPLEMGMGGVVVTGVEEVYGLGEVLRQPFSLV